MIGVDIEPRTATRDRRGAAAGLFQAGMILILGSIVVGSFFAGLQVRRWAWDVTEPIRFRSDLRNAFRWGMLSTGPEGFFNQYDKMARQTPEAEPWLDYSPLRLLVINRWCAWLRRHDALLNSGNEPGQWTQDLVFNVPMLLFNASMDWLGAACAACIVLIWYRRCCVGPIEPLDPLARAKRRFAGVWRAVAAALLLWFGPGMISVGYAYPQWDVWAPDGFLAALLLASLDGWFAAGIAIAVTVNLKGQTMAVAPALLLWPIAEGKFKDAARYAAGAIFGMALIASPWLLSYLPASAMAAARQRQVSGNADTWPVDLFAIPRQVDWAAIAWIAGILVAAIVLPRMAGRLQAWIARRFQWGAPRAKWAAVGLCAAAMAMACFWPWFIARNHALWRTGLVVSVAIALAVTLLRRGDLRWVLPLVTGACMLLCMEIFHASRAWWDCGFGFGTHHWPWMEISNTSNLPAIFHLRFNWPRAVDATAFAIDWPFHQNVSTRQLFDTVFTVLLILSGIGLGRQARRRDPRVLVAMATPWLLFYAFPVQIHQRYLCFGSAVACLAIGQSVGMAVLGLFLACVTTMMALQIMMWYFGSMTEFGAGLHQRYPWLFSAGAGNKIRMYFDAMHPDIGWAVVLGTLIFLWVSLTPTRWGIGAERRGMHAD